MWGADQAILGLQTETVSKKKKKTKTKNHNRAGGCRAEDFTGKSAIQV